MSLRGLFMKSSRKRNKVRKGITSRASSNEQTPPLGGFPAYLGQILPQAVLFQITSINGKPK